MDVALVNDIPGRPLDKCSVLSQVDLIASDIDECFYAFSDMAHALQNRTAAQWGNVAVLVKYSSIILAPPAGTSYVGVQGMAMNCSPEALTAAGISSGIVEYIEGAHSQSESIDDDPALSPQKRGSRGRVNAR